MRPHRSLALLFQGAAIFAALCGSMPAAAPAKSSVCDALPNADVERLLGVSVSSRRALVDKDGVSVCSLATGGSGRISIVVRRNVRPDWAAAQSGRMRAAASFRPVAGLSDQAFLYQLRTAAAVLCVFSGSLYLQVAVVRPDDSAVASVSAERLSRAILARLERRVLLAAPVAGARQ